MHIGITGASGFVGRRVVAAALAHQHRVTPFSRDPETRLTGCEPTRLFGINLDLGGLDAIIHLAGESIFGLWTPRKRKRILESRIGSIREIAAACARSPSPPSTLVVASGVDIYGDHGEEPVNETSSLDRASFLSQVADALEREGWQVESKGLRFVPVRLSMVLGPDGGAFKVMKPVFQLGLGGRIGSGAQWMSWIHLRDAAGLFLHAAETGEVRGPMNAASPNPVRNKEFTQILGVLLHRPTLFPVPEFPLKSLPGRQGSLVLNSQRIVPEVALRTGFQFEFPDLRGALEEILRGQR